MVKDKIYPNKANFWVPSVVSREENGKEAPRITAGSNLTTWRSSKI